MTENTPDPTPEQPELPAAPDDVDEAIATGHAVYDRVLGRFVGPVHRDGKPDSRTIRELTGGHRYKVVRV